MDLSQEQNKQQINNLSFHLEVSKNESLLIYRSHFSFKAMEDPILNKSKRNLTY